MGPWPTVASRLFALGGAGHTVRPMSPVTSRPHRAASTRAARAPARPWRPTTFSGAAAGVGAAALAALALVRRWSPERTTADVLASASTPMAALPGAALAGLLSVTGHRRAALVAGGATAYLASKSLPRWRMTGARAGLPWAPRWGRELDVVFCNVWCLNHRFEDLAAKIAERGPDVIALVEITGEHLCVLDSALGKEQYPWRWSKTDDRHPSTGLALLSKFPIGEVELRSMWGDPSLDAVVQPPWGKPLRLTVVHTCAPLGGHVERWRDELSAVARWVSVPWPHRGAIPPSRSVVVGDFNATAQHKGIRRLLAQGLVDAASSRAGGWAATWPAHRCWAPLLRLDHIFVGPELGVVSSGSTKAPGSDHKMVFATIMA